MGSIREWGKLTWPEFEHMRQSVRVAILPIGAVEEHGPHLPLDTDNLTAAAFARRIAERTDTLLLPAMNYGQVWSLSRFPGSLSISNDTMRRFVCELGIGLKSQGMRALVIVSGHLGNMGFLKEAARELHAAADFTVMPLFYPGLKEASAGVLEAPMSHPGIVHADELETSLVLALAPDAARMDKAVAEYAAYPPEFEYVPMYWDEVNESGVFGDATKATKEKGELVIERVLDNAVRLVNRLTETTKGERSGC